jgi:hypothetical protein
MPKTAFLMAILAIATASSLSAPPANAQAIRTWVSGVGDDANPCSRTAPCKTFAGAISKTFINGIIDCIDSGAFGAVTITKSITIDCRENLAGVLASSTNGIIVNIGVNANDPLRTVHLRNLQIDGAGASGSVGTRTGLNGIRILAGNAVYIENVVVQNFTQDDVAVVPSTNMNVFIRDSVLGDATGNGLQVNSPASQNVKVTLDDVHLNRNGTGVRVIGTGIAVVTLNHSFVEANAGAGIVSDGANANVVLSDTVVSRNVNGLVSANAGQFFSYGNNNLAGNGATPNAAATPLPLQ